MYFCVSFFRSLGRLGLFMFPACLGFFIYVFRSYVFVLSLVRSCLRLLFWFVCLPFLLYFFTYLFRVFVR